MYKVMLLVLLSLVSYAKDITINNKYENHGEWIIELEPLSNITVDNMTLFNGDKDFNLTHQSISKESIVYMLIDSSYPMKTAYKKGIKPLIKKLYRNKNINEKWIVSEFDIDLKVIYNELNGTVQSLDKNLDDIKIQGKRTELWKNTLEAITLLNKVGNNSKKVLVIFSDGKAEDKAYKIENVIKKAKETGIRIVALGYRDLGTEKTDYIQNMERIASDTNGKFWNTNKKHQLNKGFVDEFNNFIGNSSKNIIETKLPRESVKPTLTGKRNFILTVNHSQGNTELNFSLDVLKSSSIISLEEKSIWEKYMYYIVVAILLLLLLLLFLLTRKKEAGSTVSDNSIIDSELHDIMNDDPIPLVKNELSYVACFEALGGGVKHYVKKLPSSIGSSPESDVIIEGKFISSVHAKIEFRDGYFYIKDKNSTNKLYVNDKEVTEEKLNHDDKVSFGPYNTIFKIKMS